MKLAFILTSSLALFILGLFAGTWIRPDSGPTAPSSVTKPEEMTRTQPPQRPFRAAHQTFAQAAAETNLFQRKLSLLTATSRINDSECRRMLEECDPEDEMALRLIAERWASLDPVGMLAHLTKENPSLLGRPGVVETLFTTWSRNDPDQAYAEVHLAGNHSPRRRDQFSRLLIGSLLHEDPEKAIEFASRTQSVGEGLSDIFADWSDDDPNQAAELILSMPRCNFKRSSAAQLARRWGEEDPLAALQFASQLEPVAREHAAEYVVRGWLKRDLEAAQQYVDSTDPVTRGRLGKNLAAELAKENPNHAREWVDTHLQGEARSSALKALVHYGARSHPATAAAIASEFPAGKVRQDSLNTAAKQWFEQDSAAAAAWLEGLEGALRHEALQGLKRAAIPVAERQHWMKSLKR